jgi:hypothetical protein
MPGLLSKNVLSIDFSPVTGDEIATDQSGYADSQEMKKPLDHRNEKGV